jgi:cyanate permease
LFLVEGFPSIIVAAFVWTSMPDGPESAKFLTAREKKVAVSRLKNERESSDEKNKNGTTKKPKLKIREILQALKDPKCYLTASMFFSCNVAFSSMPVFLPTIIQEMGWSSLMSQALSAPPYLVSFAVVLLTAYASDKAKARSPFIMLHATLAASGYLLIFLAGVLGLPSWIRYLGVYPATAGFFTCVTLIITWTINNQDSDSKKGTGVALLQYFGQCGPLLGTRLYPKSDGPLYLKGMSVCAGFMMLVGFLAWLLRMKLIRENRRLAAERMVEEVEEDVELLADGSQRRANAFVYLL